MKIVSSKGRRVASMLVSVSLVFKAALGLGCPCGVQSITLCLLCKFDSCFSSSYYCCYYYYYFILLLLLLLFIIIVIIDFWIR